MSEFESNMTKLFRLMFEKTVNAIVSNGIVKSVDKTKDICVLSRDEQADMINVRLKAVTDSNNNKIILYPVIGSTVLYVLIDNNHTQAFVIAFSEVESVFMKVGNQKLELNSDKIIINDGLNDGLIKINELTSKLNELTNTINSLVDSHNSHEHPTTATIGATSVVGVVSKTISQAQKLKAFKKADYENEKIKH